MGIEKIWGEWYDKEAAFLKIGELSTYAGGLYLVASRLHPSLQSLADDLYMGNHFMNNKKCILNPSFGTASLMAGGADADLIMGGTLIDIKTTITLKFTRGYFLQLIGYYILNDLGGIDEVKDKIKIKKLEIYYSRYGYLFTFKVTDIVSAKDFKEFRELFIDVAQGFT